MHCTIYDGIIRIRSLIGFTHLSNFCLSSLVITKRFSHSGGRGRGEGEEGGASLIIHAKFCTSMCKGLLFMCIVLMHFEALKMLMFFCL